MSFSRWNGLCDVYTYYGSHRRGCASVTNDSDGGLIVGYVCCGCGALWSEEDACYASYVTEDVWAFIGHLMQHRFGGDVVPQYCFDNVIAYSRGEVDGQA